MKTISTAVTHRRQKPIPVPLGPLNFMRLSSCTELSSTYLKWDVVRQLVLLYAAVTSVTLVTVIAFRASNTLNQIHWRFSKYNHIIVVCLTYRLQNTSDSKYRGADKSLARPTSRCILFDGENISFDASLVIYINSTNIPLIVITNRIYEHQNLLSL